MHAVVIVINSKGIYKESSDVTCILKVICSSFHFKQLFVFVAGGLAFFSKLLLKNSGEIFHAQEKVFCLLIPDSVTEWTG